jgi:uncharacterized membrane protein YgdD (TMEM256/DUF423 family)
MGLLSLTGAFGAQAYTGMALEKQTKVTMTEARYRTESASRQNHR